MVTQILSLLGQTITIVASWFNEVLDKTDGKPVWITTLFVVMSYKFLLSPIFGHMTHELGSDTVRKFKRKGDE